MRLELEAKHPASTLSESSAGIALAGPCELN
jgi:hypothetical protein